MKKAVFVPATLDVAECATVTHRQWICGEMENRVITNGELFRRMSALGLEGQSANIVSKWRSDTCKVRPETLPWLLGALGISNVELCAWVVHFICAAYPALAPFLQVAA